MGTDPHLCRSQCNPGLSQQPPCFGFEHGAWGLVKALSRDFAGQGITANTISPGAIFTKRTSAREEEFINRQASEVPAKRLGTPEEIASMVAHLVSEEGAYVTGQLIQINGGGAM